MKTTKPLRIKLSKNFELAGSLHKIIIFSLLSAFSLLLLPFLAYETIRIGYITPINYNEGWNAFHTTRFVDHKALYMPITGLPITPVNYPPLSFVIIGAISFFIGSVVLTGRIVSFISLLFVAFIIFKIIHRVTSDKYSAILGSLLWLTLMVRIAGSYVGMYDPQMLAHTFSVTAFYLYLKWADEITLRKICLLALLCCFALFVKHLLITVPIIIAVVLLFNNKKAFWDFMSMVVIISSIMLFASWLYGGVCLFSNFIEFDREVSNENMIKSITAMFINRSMWVLFLPFAIIFLNFQKKWMPVLIYFSFSFLLGSFAVRGSGVTVNAWFDFFIAAAIVFGLLAANAPVILRASGSSSIINDGAVLLFGILSNELIITRFTRYLGQDRVLEPSMSSITHGLQAILVLSGIALLARHKIAIIISQLLVRAGINYEIVNSITLKGIWKYPLIYGILAASLLPFSLKMKEYLGEEFWETRRELVGGASYKRLKEQEEVYRKDVELLQSIPGAALFDIPLLGFASAKDFLFDPFNGTQLILSGRIPEKILIDPINEKYFTVIVLMFDLEKELSDSNKIMNDPAIAKRRLRANWTDNVLVAIHDNYELFYPKPPRSFFYVPRKDGRDGKQG